MVLTPVTGSLKTTVKAAVGDEVGPDDATEID